MYTDADAFTHTKTLSLWFTSISSLSLCDGHTWIAASLPSHHYTLVCFLTCTYVHMEGARVGPVSGAVGGGLCVIVGVCVYPFIGAYSLIEQTRVPRQHHSLWPNGHSRYCFSVYRTHQHTHFTTMNMSSGFDIETQTHKWIHTETSQLVCAEWERERGQWPKHEPCQYAAGCH